MADTIVGWGMGGIVIATKDELLPASTNSVRKGLPWQWYVVSCFCSNCFGFSDDIVCGIAIVQRARFLPWIVFQGGQGCRFFKRVSYRLRYVRYGTEDNGLRHCILRRYVI